jgi:hypothetical protein
VAEAIQERFDDLDYLHDIGELDLNISGCMNACGHHHVGHIGILGVDKNGEEWYQVEVGGNQGQTARGLRAALGRVIGPRSRAPTFPTVIEKLDRLLSRAPRQRAERFVDVVHRLASSPFKEASMATLIKERRSFTRARSSPDARVIRSSPATTRASVAARARPRDARRSQLPQFGDGRGFSIARLLRGRYGYKGELRAVGHITRDTCTHGRVGSTPSSCARARTRTRRSPLSHDLLGFYQRA